MLRYALEAAKVLDYLNKPRHFADRGPPVGILHGDVKPQNILLVGDGVKVGDFGLVQLLKKGLTAHGGGMTPAYAAPEFFEGQASRWAGSEGSAAFEVASFWMTPSAAFVGPSGMATFVGDSRI